MNNFIDVANIVLTLVGVYSIFKNIIKVFFEKKRIDNSVIIYSVENETEIEKKYRSYKTINLKGNNIVVIEPNCSIISSIKIYDVKIGKNGKVRKKNLLEKEKNILQNEACILYLDYYCCIPSYIVELKNNIGGKCKIEIYQNGFNGNNDFLKGLEWKYSFVIRFIQLLIK